WVIPIFSSSSMSAVFMVTSLSAPLMLPGGGDRPNWSNHLLRYLCCGSHRDPSYANSAHRLGPTARSNSIRRLTPSTLSNPPHQLARHAPELEPPGRPGRAPELWPPTQPPQHLNSGHQISRPRRLNSAHEVGRPALELGRPARGEAAPCSGRCVGSSLEGLRRIGTDIGGARAVELRREAGARRVLGPGSARLPAGCGGPAQWKSRDLVRIRTSKCCRRSARTLTTPSPWEACS